MSRKLSIQTAPAGPMGVPGLAGGQAMSLAARPLGARAVRRVLGRLLLAGAFGLGALMVVPALFGFERYVITGGSMSGSIELGAVAFARAVPVADLRVGDVITYEPPPGSGPAGLVTHRIIEIRRDASGLPEFLTKGDGNRIVDPWGFFKLTAPTQARVAFHVPLVGHLLAALGIRWVRMLVIGLPALCIGLAIAVSLWRRPDDHEGPPDA